MFSFIGIIIYYLNKNLINKTILINLYKIKDFYINKNIIKIIILILEKIGIIFYFRYFIGDNISNNNIY